MAKKTFHMMLTLFVGLVAFAVLGMGCGGGTTTTPTDDGTPKLEFKVNRITQRTNIGQKGTPGGQFVIVNVLMTNDTDAEIRVNPQDFVIRKKPKGLEDVYETTPETMMEIDYKNEFGLNSGDNYFKGMLKVRPGFKLPQDMIFNIPGEADPSLYELMFKPYDLKIALDDSELEIVDERVETEAEEEI